MCAPDSCNIRPKNLTDVNRWPSTPDVGVMRSAHLSRLLVIALVPALLLACAVAGATAGSKHDSGKSRAGAAKQRIGLGARVVAKGQGVRAGRQARPARSEEHPGVLFRGDFESGFEGWHVQSLSYRANLLYGRAFQGGAAARFEVHDGDVEPETGSERSEVSGPTFQEGHDLYIRDAIRIPAASSYDGPWQIVQQLHEHDWGGSPGVAVFLEDDDSIAIHSGDGSRTYWEGPELSRDRWHDLVYRVHLSRDPGAGFVEVWLDGAQQVLDNGSTRVYGQTIQTTETYIKAGIYRSRSSTGVSLVEHDAIVVGTSLAAVIG